MAFPAQTATVVPGSGLDHIDVWVFDLDNTLYPASCNLFDQVDRRMGEFIARTLGLDFDSARRLQKQYFYEHGTTLRGLMTVHGLEPDAFLEYVHDIDLSMLPPSEALDAALQMLDGRKLIFTNGTASHAWRVVEHLGVARHFEAVVDIAASDYLPKPDPRAYEALIRRFGIRPESAALIDDMATNLLPAHALGMTTVWVRHGYAWAHPPSCDDHVHHMIDDLVSWLTDLVAARQRACDGERTGAGGSRPAHAASGPGRGDGGTGTADRTGLE